MNFVIYLTKFTRAIRPPPFKLYPLFFVLIIQIFAFIFYTYTKCTKFNVCLSFRSPKSACGLLRAKKGPLAFFCIFSHLCFQLPA